MKSDHKTEKSENKSEEAVQLHRSSCKTDQGKGWEGKAKKPPQGFRRQVFRLNELSECLVNGAGKNPECDGRDPSSS